jgi:hypothetical protein
MPPLIAEHHRAPERLQVDQQGGELALGLRLLEQIAG